MNMPLGLHALRLAPALLLLAATVALPTQHACADDFWSVTMSADAGSDGSNHSLEFGTRSGATGGFDAGGIDVPTPPPAPGVAFGASFRIADPIFSLLNGDYREALPADAGTSITWTLSVSSTSQPTTLTWSDPASAGLPSAISLTLTNGGTSVNMRAANSATFPAGSQTLTIRAAREAPPATATTTPSTVPDDENGSGDEDQQGSDDGHTNDASDSEVEADEVVPGRQEALRCTALSVEPAQSLPGQDVTVSATICNPGGETSSATPTLLVNGEAIQSETISLSAGACRQVMFKISRGLPGTYHVAIENVTGQFSVVDPGAAPTTVPPPRQSGLDATGLIVLTATVAFLVTATVTVLRRR